ncbi:MAG TPA: sugar phosphate isomerase/epimerase [Gemmataceae bacterium]|nr:sugar phosphate isomerase/epimerase [Gemmataceae bacterium]
MQLGFVSAILPDLSLEELLAFAAAEGFDCVELMCWPVGKGEQRRYSGVTHLDVTSFDVAHVQSLVKKHGVAISGLGYYPNPLDPDPQTRQVVQGHLKKVITAASALGIGIVNTFIGRDQFKSIPANWPLVEEIWPPIVRHATASNVKLCIENCPMLFTQDEWPGGKNLATSPAMFRKLFDFQPALGLNFDPSHMIWQFIDSARCIREFGKKVFHVHAKDTRIDADKLYEQGNLGFGWHTAKLPGLGDVDWSALFAALTDVGYNGPVCIEVEDRAYEGSVADRKRALRQSARYLRQFMA